MIELTYSSIPEWLSAKRGLISGGRMQALKVAPRKKGDINAETWAVVAEQLTDEDPREGIDWKTPLQRGTFLEEEALQTVSNFTGVEIQKLDTVIWKLEKDSEISSSPDGATADRKIVVETKCLDSKNHLQMILSDDPLPKEYEWQAVQYFLVNNVAEEVWVAFYDPRFKDPRQRLAIFKVTREDVQDQIDRNKEVIEKTRNNIASIKERVLAKYPKEK